MYGRSIMDRALGNQREEPQKRGAFREVLAVLICTFAYLYVSPLYPGINNPNENVRFYMTAALVDDGTYEISGPREAWGWTNDAAEVEGRFYSVKAPGTSFAGVPGYALYRLGTQAMQTPFERNTALWLCRVSAVTIPMLYFLLFFYRFLQRATGVRWVGEAVFYTVALGSLLYGYSLLFVSHSVSAALAFLAFASMYQARRRLWKAISPAAAFGVGLATAGVTFFEYPGLIISVLLTAYAVISLRPFSRLVWFVLGAAVPTLVMMHFQDAAFGSPWTPGHLMVENPAFRTEHEQGFFGATGVHPEAVLGLLFDPGYGLFPLSPLLIMSIPGFVLLIRKRDTRMDGLVVLACVTLTTAAICTMLNWRGGWTLGPRYLATLVPLLAWPAAVGLAAAARRAPRLTGILGVAGLAVSLVASGVPSAYYPHIPEALERPLGDLFLVLVRHGFAPLNAGQLLGLYGTPSMIPWAAAVGIALLVVLTLVAQSEPKQTRLVGPVSGLLGLCVALGCVGWMAKAVHDGPHSELKLITETWHPAGQDRTARLAAALEQEPSVEGFKTLAALYAAQARPNLARSAEQQAQALSSFPSQTDND